MNLSAASRIALREMRGGLAAFRVLLICLALGVATIAAVGSVREGIGAGLSDQAAELLGGDAELKFTYRFAGDAERAWMARTAAEVSEIVDFRSMLAYTGGEGSTERALVQVKAVDASYPLYGNITLAGGGDLAVTLDGGGDLPGLVAHKALLDRTGLAPGDTVSLGTQEFRLTGLLLQEPDSLGGGFSFGPRVIVRRESLTGSGLLEPGSMFNAAYRLRLPADAGLPALRADATSRFGETGLQWTDRRNGTPGLNRFVGRMGAFLVLIGLAGLAVGGIGVSVAVRSYLEGKRGTIAVLKTLGATGGTVFAAYLIQTGLLSLAGILAGVALGAALPLIASPLIEASLPVPVEIGLYPAPLAQAALYGILTALTFTILPLARATGLRPAGLFRDAVSEEARRPRPGALILTALPATALVASAAAFSGAPRLALGVAAGLTVTLAVLALSARALSALARKASLPGHPPLRWALSALGGPGSETGTVVLALGLGLTVLTAVGQIDASLQRLITGDLPDRAPAYFFVDIQDSQLGGFLDRSTGTSGVSGVETAPMLRGIITRINGRPAQEVAPGHWVLRGDRGVTYSEAPPDGTVLTEGEWWPPGYNGEPVMSFAAEEAEELGVGPGDNMTVNILGRDLTATITSLRDVKFQSMGISFVMIMNPAALKGAPHSHIATVYSDHAAEVPLLQSVTEAWPNITAIRVRDALERIAGTLEGLGSAVRWGASTTLLTGLVVLAGTAVAGERRRIFESAVLRTLGASRRQILISLALRWLLTGLVAGFVAAAAGCLAAWSVISIVMESDYKVDFSSVFSIIVAGILVSLLAGMAFAKRPLSARPAQVLRSRE